MATPRILRPILLSSFLGVVLAVGVAPPTVGQAEPQRSAADVQREVSVLNAKIDAAAESYDQARIELSAAARRTAAAQHRLAEQAKVIDVQRRAMGQVAVAIYRSGATNQVVSLVTASDPRAFLDRAASLNRISTRQSYALRDLQVAQLAYQQAQTLAGQQLAAQRKVAATLKAARDTIQSALDRQQALLSSLRAAERRQITPPRPRPQKASYNGPASGRAALAIKFAYAQLGKPYQWGGAGPDSYDCSGLTMASWAQAGVSLPHSSRAQYNSGQRVDRSNLQPGDLIFYGNPIGHVSLYIGGGKAIDAPHTGEYVKIDNAPFRSDYVGAVRP